MGDHRKLLLQHGGLWETPGPVWRIMGRSPASVDTMRNSWSSAGDLVRLGEERLSGLSLEG